MPVKHALFQSSGIRKPGAVLASFAVAANATFGSALAAESQPGSLTHNFYNLQTDTLGDDIDPDTVEDTIRAIAEDPQYAPLDTDTQEQVEAKMIAQQLAIQSYLNSVDTQNTLCVEQLEPIRYALDGGARVGDIVGLALEAAGSIFGGAGTETPGILYQAGAQVLGLGSYVIDGVQTFALPNCNAEFTGTIQARANIAAKMGVSAHDGRLTLGDPSGVNYSDGITLGGGSLLGAGFGGAQAFAGHQDAIAIGNNASAADAGSLALGLNASATAADATAIGNGAQATAAGATAIGSGATATNTDAIAVGTSALASGPGSIAIGQNAVATGSVAVGAGATASNGGAAFGDNSTATGSNATAVGPSANATQSNSAAFGAGATATQANQQVFGTASNSYTMPGVSSAQSASRQTGPLALVTTDAAGNLASDNGAMMAALSSTQFALMSTQAGLSNAQSAISKTQAGISIALAGEAPSLTSEESFGVRMGWGNFNGVANGVAGSAIGVVCRDCLKQGDRLAIDASIGAGWSEYQRQDSGTVVGGRAGVQWTW